RNDACRFAPYEPVGLQARELKERVREVAREVDVVAILDRRDVDFALTHELLNDIAAQHIVFVQRHAAPYRQASLIERVFPAWQVACILAETVADVTDRAHA